LSLRLNECKLSASRTDAVRLFHTTGPDTIQHHTMEEFNVDSKAKCGRLNQAHVELSAARFHVPLDAVYVVSETMFLQVWSNQIKSLKNLLKHSLR